MHDSSATATAPYISIKEASIRYQKAEITIRRFVRSVLEQEKCAERTMIHPLPSEAVKLKKQKKPFAYTISEDLLKKQYGEGSASSASHGSGHGSYMHLLERTNRNLEDQMKVKDEQIRVLAQAIDGLSERQRETNVLMKGLQERFFLSAPKEEIVEGVAEISRRKANLSNIKQKKKQKSGIIGWLFS
ncbi:hypothetical protein FJZ27_00365 [Candidatus Peribacteria bacterium]|nr:hypothetical protein [Candidatus Peribacteria bacterium]